MFAIPFRECYVFYQGVRYVLVECKSSHALVIPTPVVFVNMMNKARPETGLDREWIQKVSGTQHHVLSLGVFSHCVRYGPTDRSAFSLIVSGCEGGAALL